MSDVRHPVAPQPKKDREVINEIGARSPLDKLENRYWDGCLMNTGTRFAALLRKLQAARMAEAEALAELAMALGNGMAESVSLLDDPSSPTDYEPCDLSVRQLAERIPYNEHTIRNMVSSGQLVEGKYYFKRRRRVIFSWLAMREGPQALPGLSQA
jgi:hypothetical protein